MNFYLTILTPLFTFLFLSNFSYATDSLPQCLNQASANLDQEKNTKVINDAYRRCISQFKKKATYSQCADTMKSLKHKDMIYICASVKQNGSLDECLKSSSEVYESLDNRLAGFGFKSCIENFKNEGSYIECVDNIKSSKHKDNIDLCNVVKKNGTYSRCLQENISAFTGVNSQKRILTAYRSCADSFRNTSDSEECLRLLRLNNQNHFLQVCLPLPKQERHPETSDQGDTAVE